MSRTSSLERHYALFDTPIGRCAVVWSPSGIVRMQLPEADDQQTVRRLGDAVEASPPEWVARVIQQVVRHLGGDLQDLSSVPLDLTGITPFARGLYEAARFVEAGRTITYSELAQRMGVPGGARAVGRALGANPFSLVVPCHRVVAASGTLRGFSAHGGLSTKAKLLAIEGGGVWTRGEVHDEV